MLHMCDLLSIHNQLYTYSKLFKKWNQKFAYKLSSTEFQIFIIKQESMDISMIPEDITRFVIEYIFKSDSSI
mgnify:CR=1 FL=1